MSNTAQNMAESLNPLLSPINLLLVGATVGNQGSPMMDLQCSEVFPNQQ